MMACFRLGVVSSLEMESDGGSIMVIVGLDGSKGRHIKLQGAEERHGRLPVLDAASSLFAVGFLNGQFSSATCPASREFLVQQCRTTQARAVRRVHNSDSASFSLLVTTLLCIKGVNLISIIM